MSDNPYQQPSYDQPVFGQSIGPQPAAPQPPKKKGWSVAFWVILILGIIFVLGCGCCGGLFYWGIGFFADNVSKSYKDNPVVIEKIGEIKSASLNFQATRESGGEIVFDLKGSKNNGQLFLRDQDQQTQTFGGARLVVEGEEFELGPTKPFGQPNEPEKQNEDQKGENESEAVKKDVDQKDVDQKEAVKKEVDTKDQ